jgi:hypothetical protein
MLTRALDAGAVAGDGVCGADPKLRLRSRLAGFVQLDHCDGDPADRAGQHWLLICRNRTTGELALNALGWVGQLVAYLIMLVMPPWQGGRLVGLLWGWVAEPPTSHWLL